MAARKRDRGDTGQTGELNGDVMNLRDAAEYLRSHPSTVYRLARNGQLPAFRLGGGWRFLRSAIDAWIEQQRALAPVCKPAAVKAKGRPKLR